MKIPIYQVDAFTRKVFGGNPAAVCPLESWLEDGQLQLISAENNLSETAFFVRQDKCFDIRWFTPAEEVDLCGHATLASAHVLFNHLGYKGNSIHFRSRYSGDLYVKKEGEKLVLDFPASKLRKVPVPEALARGLGKEPLSLFLARDYLAVFESEEDILRMNPDDKILKNLDVTGIIVTAPGKEVDFVSRFFAPAVGIPEDPVTGSAHTMLTPYWADRLGKNKLHALQLSARKGELFCEMTGERVLIGGYACSFMKGEIIPF